MNVQAVIRTAEERDQFSMVIANLHWKKAMRDEDNFRYYPFLRRFLYWPLLNQIQVLF